MGNDYAKAILTASRKGDSMLKCSDCDYLDVGALSGYLTKQNKIELKDEAFNFEEFNQMTAKIYRLFITLDKLDYGFNKEIVKLILKLSEFTSRKTSETRISLIQSLLKRMLTAFLGDCLTAKPFEAETHNPIVFDEDDAGKSILTNTSLSYIMTRGTRLRPTHLI